MRRLVRNRAARECNSQDFKLRSSCVRIIIRYQRAYFRHNSHFGQQFPLRGVVTTVTSITLNCAARFVHAASVSGGIRCWGIKNSGSAFLPQRNLV